MPNLKDIRRRIKTVHSTQQITKAMKMIAAVKLRKAQDQILACRPYAHELISVISHLAFHTETVHHPLLKQKTPRKVHTIVVTSNRGLCGSYNGNIIRRAEKFIREETPSFETFGVSFIGKKGHEYFKTRLGQDKITKFYEESEGERTFDHALGIADELMDLFIQGELDQIRFIYNEFKSAISQKVVVETLLPVTPTKEESGRIDYLYEPSRKEVLEALLPKYVRTQVYRILLEAISSEHGARMTAMDSATRNAGEMINKLTLTANRLRQAAITTELMEIVSGAEAQKS